MNIKEKNMRARSNSISAAVGVLKDYMECNNLSQQCVANRLKVSQGFIAQIITGQKSISMDFCLRLEMITGVRAYYIWDIESRHRLAEYTKNNFERLSKEIKPRVK